MAVMAGRLASSIKWPMSRPNSEVMLNSLKNKAQDKSQAALTVKKPRRAEVNNCLQHPKGETTDCVNEYIVSYIR